ncbi:MAG: DegT/DnrJ/EryC1/StrS family aminotransferase [Bacteroidota bacterium]
MPGFEMFGDLERASVNEVLDTGVLMRYGFDGMRKNRWKAMELEQKLAARMQTEYAHLTSSGTSALTVALACMGIGAGDEVIMPTFTFVASFESILAVGAVPILVDIDETLTLNPEAVRRAVTAKTRAIMPVHMCGSMADLDALKAICEEKNLFLLEDACQAIGGTYKGLPLGSIGDAGCFSFDYVKTITCGEGGGLITNSKYIYERAHMFSDHGHDHIGKDRGAEAHPFLGYNFRISELNAAVGLAQMDRLDEFLAIQEKNYGMLRNALEDIEGLSFRKVPEGGIENYSFLNFFMASETQAKKVHTALSTSGIDACFYWYDNNWHYYRKWEHLLQEQALFKLPEEVRLRIKVNSEQDFSLSDQWMGRNISCLVKIGWKAEEVQQRAKLMRSTIQAAIQ